MSTSAVPLKLGLASSLSRADPGCYDSAGSPEVNLNRGSV
jgi:hypothetical protein